ncbi:MAG: putative zinc metalloprotease [Chlamydiae bacterium]|nr:putative zinc metalloprotease [Chlamydiota bacterium]
MENLLYILLALFGFGMLIFLHELGHYVVAKWQGMTIDTFSIGFGRPILKWKVGGTSWQLGWIPFGGYVKIKGMENEGKKQAHEIEGGYFQKSPLSRIKVALAGPIVNFALALFFFTIIWASGGREMPFQDSTQIVGFVEPKSKLYELGIRSGDVITTVNGQKFTSFQDLISASVMNPDGVNIQGYSLNAQNEKVSFDYTYKVEIDPDQMDKTRKNIQTILPASYLIYDAKNISFPMDDLPIANSGIQDQDRILWVDGSVIYSLSQLHAILRESASVLTIQRNGHTFVVKVPRAHLTEFYLQDREKNELEDWAYELKVEKDAEELFFMPYMVSMSGVVESTLEFIEEKPFLMDEKSLQIGDRIIAVDGKKVTTAYDIFKALQSHEHLMIVQRNPKLLQIAQSTGQDEVFETLLQKSVLIDFANHVGSNSSSSQKDLYLLKPTQALSMEQMMEKSSTMALTLEEQKAKILQISNQEKRQTLIKAFNTQLQQPFLGLSLKDRQVTYNPNPFASFGKVYTETIRTIQALIQGNTSPKWLSGPLGIFQVMHTGFSISLKQGLFWLAAISLNLAILNLLPIPPLDGGHVVFYTYELITRKRVSMKTMNRVTIPFMILFIMLFVFTTFQDLSRFFGKFF